MLHGLKQTATVKPGGVIEIQSPELPVGSTVEVIVLVDIPAETQFSHPHLAELNLEEPFLTHPRANNGWQRNSEVSEIFEEIERDRRVHPGSRHRPVED